MTIAAKPVKIALLFLFFTLLYQTSKAQNITSTKIDSAQIKRAENVYFEFGGAGLFVSVDYDTRFAQQRDGFGARIGVGYFHFDGYSFLTVPLQINYLLGKKSNFLELGLGGTLLSFNNIGNTHQVVGFNNTPIGNPSVQGIMTIGYRYQPVKGGFNFRAGFNPLFNTKTIVPFDYFGISLGYTFR